MKIESIEILGFGKLSNVRFNFGKGLNVIYGKNEAGKSTIQAFLKAMLFSPRTPRVNDPVKNYTPWKSDVFGGNLMYSMPDEKKYRVERDFGKGFVRIFDEKLSDISDTFEQSRERGPLFARKHLGMDEDFFEKTAFIKQMETRLTHYSRKSLVDSAINLIHTGSESTSIEGIVDEINSKIKYYIGNTRTKIKPLEQLSHEIEELTREKANLIKKRDEELAKSMDTHLLARKREIELEKEMIRDAFDLITLNLQIEILKEKESAKKAMLESFKQNCGPTDSQNRRVDEMEIGIQIELDLLKSQLIQRYEHLEKVELALENQQLLKKKAEKHLTAVKETVERSTKKTDWAEMMQVFKDHLDIVIPTTVAMGIYMLTKFYLDNPFLNGLAIVFAVLYPTVRVLIYRHYNAGDVLNRDELARVFKEVGVSNLNEYYKIFSDFEAKIQEIERLNFEIVELETKVDRIESLKGNAGKAAFSSRDIEATLLESARIQEQLTTIEAEIRQKQTLLDQQMVQIQLRLTGYKKDPLNETELKIYAHQLDRELEKLLGQIKESEMMERYVADLEQQIQKMQEELEVKIANRKKLEDLNFSLNTAISSIKEAGEDLKNSALPLINKNFSQIASKLTSGKYSQLNITEMSDIKTISAELNRVVDVALLSGGTIEQINLALRLSLAKGDIVSHSVPIIMDEVFAYFDDDSMNHSFQYLQELSESNQIFFFTCKQREAEMAIDIFGNRGVYFEVK